MSVAMRSETWAIQKYPSCFFFSIDAAASWSITRPWRSRGARQQHLLDDLPAASSASHSTAPDSG